MIEIVASIISGLAFGVLAGSVLAQLQTEPPTDLITFQWVVITVLAGAVGTLFWQYNKTRDNNLQKMDELQDMYYKAIVTNTEALKELKYAITDVASLSRLDGRLANLEKRLEQQSKGQSGD